MKKRFVILPLKGISGPAMAASVFQTGGGRLLPEVFKKDVRPLVEGIPESSGIAQATPATVELSGIVADEDFATLSQRFPDGPAVVSMTDAGRRAFEASFPSLRVLPITTYHLPGRSPRSKRAKPEGAVVAGQSAVAAGQVFTADAKQRFLTSASAGAGGRGVRVGVLDTGVDNAHPALAPAVSVLRCYIPDAPPTAGGPVNWGPALLERSGHGTHVAGIIAARGGHGGPAGVAPEAEIVSYRIFPDNPSRQMGAENAVIIDSIRAAIDDGCHIINLSIEGPSLKEDGVRTAVSDAWAQGVVCIAAAGNGFGNPVSYPAALQHCVAVTAIGHDDAFPQGQGFEQHVSNQRATADPKIFLASFSNFGPPVQFTAPGHAIVSTFPGGGWWFDSGTSMAAPFISGVLARLLSTNSNILNMRGNADRSAAMLQMLVGRARLLKLPQAVQEGYGLPL